MFHLKYSIDYYLAKTKTVRICFGCFLSFGFPKLAVNLPPKHFILVFRIYFLLVQHSSNHFFMMLLMLPQTDLFFPSLIKRAMYLVILNLLRCPFICRYWTTNSLIFFDLFYIGLSILHFFLCIYHRQTHRIPTFFLHAQYLHWLSFWNNKTLYFSFIFTEFQ